MNKTEYAEYKASVARTLEGLDYPSSGPCPGCSECLEPDLESYWPEAYEVMKFLEDQVDQELYDRVERSLLETLIADPPVSWYDSANEPHFSWNSCDICNRPEGGDRCPVHAVGKDGSILHFNACEDCVYYMEYGRLGDQTMDEIESNTGD